MGVTSERKLVMELQCNMALRWFVGLNLDQDAWDASTFSQNRRRRFDQAGLLERLFELTKDDGRRGYTLEVRVSNAGAIKLYEEVGFRPRGVRRGYYTDNREDALIMWKDPVSEPATYS